MPKTEATGEAPKESPKSPSRRIRQLGIELLSPAQVGFQWFRFEDGLSQVFSSYTDTQKSALMGAMADGRLQVWTIFSIDSEKAQYVGFALTAIYERAFIKERVLTLYALWTAGLAVDAAAWIEALGRVEDYARKEGCTCLDALTENSRIVQLMKQTGFHLKTYGEKRI